MAHQHQHTDTTSSNGTRPWGNEHDSREDSEFLKDARDVLNEVYAIFRAREGYGPPSDHHERAAGIISILDGMRLTPAEHCLSFLVDKLVREANEHKEDNLLDSIGYLVIMMHHHRRATRRSQADGVIA